MQDLNSLLSGRARSILSSEHKPLGFSESAIVEVLKKEGFEKVDIGYLSTKTRKLGLSAPNGFLAGEVRMRAEELQAKINRHAGRVIVSSIMVRVG